jgi:putative ABC transport system permease protein
VLVAAEIALALVLLAGAGLLLRSFEKLKEVEPGFRPDHVLTIRLELPETRYGTFAQQRLFHSRLLESLNAIPGASAALVSELPMSGEELSHSFVIAGRPPIAAGAEPEVETRTVTPGYFEVLGIPARAGRTFRESDGTQGELVAVVNAAFVREYFPGENPVGARVEWAREDPPHWMTIVGVVGDVSHFGPALPELPAVYDLYAQTDKRWKRWMFVVVRSAADPSSIVRSVTERIGSLDRQLPPTKIRALTDVVAESTGPQKLNLILLGVFAALALLLASIGIYGLISYSVAQRRHDIGVRMALGADARAIVRLVVGDGVRLAAAGAAIGLAGALLATRLMTSLLFGVGARDPWTLAAVVLVLTIVAALASWIPARWATKVDPAVALRVE